jgi:hypothetical protein
MRGGGARAQAQARARAALQIQHVTHKSHTAICGLSGSTAFFDFSSKTAQFSKKKVTNKNVSFDFLYNFYLKHFSF